MVGMGQPASVVLNRAWDWAGVVFIIATVGLITLLFPRFRPVSAVGALLLLATLAAPLNQARIGTYTSLQKHVVFGAWFGCMLAGVALTRVLRRKALIGVCSAALIAVLPVVYMHQATSLYHSWTPENSEFITKLKALVRPGNQRYLIEGYAEIPAYYVGPNVSSLQWKEAGSYSYVDPTTGVSYHNGPAFADAIRHRVFTLIILNFVHASPNEPANDYSIVAAIKKYGGYHIAGYLPPSSLGSHGSYTVWRVNNPMKQAQ
jgi:hypothetical protein